MEGHWVMRGEERARIVVMAQRDLRLECRIMCLPLFHSAVPSVSACRLQSTLSPLESLGSSRACCSNPPYQFKKPCTEKITSQDAPGSTITGSGGVFGHPKTAGNDSCNRLSIL